MMKILKFLTIVFLLSWSTALRAQTLYVDGNKGNDKFAGTITSPLASLDKAVSLANHLDGKQPILIKIGPGLYTVLQPLVIHGEKGQQTGAKFTIEAAIMPDDSAWSPAKMPVIQCIADSNRTGKLKHASCAFQIERTQVVIRGIKFIGNPHPASQYYYVIQRRDSTLNGLEVSQCYFIADKNSAPMQGGVFAQGAGIHVDHCVFYGAKNAVMVFQGLKDFSLTHTIIYGAYEGAVWYGYGVSSFMPFTFSDNVVAGGNYFWVGYRGVHSNYQFDNSLIAGNSSYMGFNEEEIMPDRINKPIEKGVRKTGNVLFDEVNLKGVPKNYLNLSAGSAGKDIDAGIFKTKN